LPIAGTTESLAFCVEESLWGEPPTVTIFQNYWQTRIEQMFGKRTRIVSYEVWVDDIMGLDIQLNDNIYVDGIKFIINEMKIDTLNKKIMLELVVLPLDYQAATISNYDGTAGFFTWTKEPERMLLKAVNLNGRNGTSSGGTIKSINQKKWSNLGTLMRIKTSLK
jgi:hypothetical protein